MARSGWLVVGLGVSFVIIQSCGDDFGTGRIMTPGATAPMSTPEEQQGPPPSGMAQLPVDDAPDAGWPPYDYDDGGLFWDGGAAVRLEGWHWNQGISNHRGEYGQRFVATCIPDGSDYAVWGSNPYTDDSPLCPAGAQLGLIRRDRGGDVMVEIRPAQRNFRGSVQNGVTGLPWGPYPGSYRVVTP
jgi:hypothetical protein